MAKGGRKAGASAAKNASAAAAKLQEDVWAQCDNPNCQKWRRLPPGTVIDENTPWSVPVTLTYGPLHPLVQLHLVFQPQSGVLGIVT